MSMENSFGGFPSQDQPSQPPTREQIDHYNNVTRLAPYHEALAAHATESGSPTETLLITVREKFGDQGVNALNALHQNPRPNLDSDVLTYTAGLTKDQIREIAMFAEASNIYSPEQLRRLRWAMNPIHTDFPG